MVARNRLVISGTLGTPAAEAWSVGMHFDAGDAGMVTTVAGLNAWAGFVAAGIIAMNPTDVPLNHLSTDGRISRLDTYYYGPTGPAIAQGSAVLSTPESGGGSVSGPFQTARCVSLLTGQAGGSFRGRIYWPAISQVPSSTGRAPVSQATADAFRNFLRLCATPEVLNTRLQLAVYSPTRDELTAVSSIRVGDVLDTQRRRRDALPENYVSSPV